MAVKLFQRHIAQGWDKSTMKDYILQADLKLQSATPSKNSQTKELSNKERVFIHLEYHPNDIPRKAIREIYDLHCRDVFEAELDIQQVTVAYSRAPNIKDTLTRAKLHQASGKPASKYYMGELVNNQLAPPIFFSLRAPAYGLRLAQLEKKNYFFQICF